MALTPSLGGATALSSSGAEGTEAEEEAAEAEVAGSFGRTASEWLLSKPCIASCMNAPHSIVGIVGKQTL